METPPDHRFRDVVTAVGHPIGYPSHCQVFVRQSEYDIRALVRPLKMDSMAKLKVRRSECADQQDSFGAVVESPEMKPIPGPHRNDRWIFCAATRLLRLRI